MVFDILQRSHNKSYVYTSVTVEETGKSAIAINARPSVTTLRGEYRLI